MEAEGEIFFSDDEDVISQGDGEVSESLLSEAVDKTEAAVMLKNNANNHEQDEIRRLKEVVKEQEEMLASRNKKMFEMEESHNKVEKKMMKVENENIKLKDEKNKFVSKLRKLVECPVCLALPRAGPVPCCANGHLVCSPCLGKLREENKLEQG